MRTGIVTHQQHLILLRKVMESMGEGKLSIFEGIEIKLKDVIYKNEFMARCSREYVLGDTIIEKTEIN